MNPTLIAALRPIAAGTLDCFNLSFLSVLFTAFACNWGGPGPALVSRLQFFPAVPCLNSTHAVHGAFAIFFTAVWVTLSVFYAASSALPRPRGRSLLAEADSRTSVRALLLRSLLAACFFVFAPGGQLKLLSLLFLLITGQLAVDAVLHGAQFSPGVRCLRAAGAAGTAFGSLVLVFRAHHGGRHGVADTQALYAGAALAGSAAAAVSYVLWRRDRARGAFFLESAVAGRESDGAITPNLLAMSLEYTYASVEEVHRTAAALARGARGAAAAADVTLALDAVFLTGVRQFPDSALLPVLHVRFRADLEADGSAPGQSGLSSVERARGLRPSFCERLYIHVAETLLKIASSDGTDGDAAMDMQAYVEFQQTLGDVLKTHRSALAANRKFWRLLMKEVLTFRALSASLAEIEFFEAKAEKAYALVLEKHPKNVILLRAYASFCEDVKNDPWRAQKVLLEAEKIDATRTMGRGDGEDDQGGGGVDDKLDCVVVISGTGTIKIANKNMHKLLGYKKKDELVGKNVSVIMPKPYNQQHNGYLKRFAKTQKSTILDSKQRLEARPCQPPPG